MKSFLLDLDKVVLIAMIYKKSYELSSIARRSLISA